jgi:FlgD Ig-like domain
VNKLIWSLLVVSLAVAGVSAGVIPDEPIQSIYWRQFRSIFVHDKTILAIGPRGIVTFDWSVQTLHPREESHLRFEMNPTRSKLFGDRLFVFDAPAKRIHIFSVDAGLTVSSLFSVPLPDSTIDFASYGDDLIVSRGFDGLWRYHLVAGAEPQLVDTSYRGVNVTALYTEGDTLYALDTYNGIMRYDLKGDTFGAFMGYLYTQYEATSFSKDDRVFTMTGVAGGVIEGAFGHSGSGVEKLTETSLIPKRLIPLADRFIYQSNRKIGWIHRFVKGLDFGWPVETGLLDGAVFDPGNGDTWLLYPNPAGGIVAFSMINNAAPLELLDRPGQITGLAFAHGQLVATGRHSPIDIFNLDSTGRATLNFSLTQSHPATGPIIAIGDTLLAIYTDDETLARLEVNFTTQKAVVAASITVDTTDILNLDYARNVRGNRDLAIVRHPQRLDVFEWVDSSHFAPATAWKPISEGINAYEVFDSLVLFATNKSAIRIHVIDENLAVGQWRKSIDLLVEDGPVTEMEYHAPYLRVFHPYKTIVYNLSNPFAPVRIGAISSSVAVFGIQRFDKYIFTVGGNGIQIFDASDSLPVLVDQGGWDGKLLAVNGNHLVVSDGNAIDFYMLSLFAPDSIPDDTGSTPPTPQPTLPTSFAISQNHPNPFNGTTYIEYDIPRASQVLIELYNPIGQKIRTLVSVTREPGRYRAMWDGRNESGENVATGIYYYRFVAGESRIVKKLLYLK